jgi:SAM-dependent methyltransferase
MGVQSDLFGYHPRDASKGQLFTPPWLARRSASLIPYGSRALEPGCGSGNMVEALLERGCFVVAVDVDPRWVDYCRKRFTGNDRVVVVEADFLAQKSQMRDMVARYFLSECLTNPDYTDNTHLDYADFLLELFASFTGIFPITFEHSQERDKFWANVGRVTHRAKMPERVKFGETGGQIDVECIRVVRRESPRTDDEWNTVLEAAWRK